MPPISSAAAHLAVLSMFTEPRIPILPRFAPIFTEPSIITSPIRGSVAAAPTTATAASTDTEDPINITSLSLGGAAGGAGAVADEVAAVAREVMTVHFNPLSMHECVIHDVSIDMKARDLKKIFIEKTGKEPKFLVLHGKKLEMDKSLKEQGCVPGDDKTIVATSLYDLSCEDCNPDNTHAHRCIHE